VGYQAEQEMNLNTDISEQMGIPSRKQEDYNQSQMSTEKNAKQQKDF